MRNRRDCDTCHLSITNQRTRSIDEKGHLLKEDGSSLDRVFTEDLIKMLLDQEIFICKPCGHALIDKYTGPNSVDEEDEDEEDTEDE